MSSPYSWVNSRRNWRDPIIIFQDRVYKIFWIFDLWSWVKKLPGGGGLNVCMNYEFNLSHHVGIVAERLREAAASAHEGDNNQDQRAVGEKQAPP